MTATEIAKEAIKRMNKRITNDIFLIIQNDRELMKEYLRSLENNSLIYPSLLYDAERKTNGQAAPAFKVNRRM